MQTASKRVINGWAMYDWANSAYNLVITSTIFPAYYTAITANDRTGHEVSFFGKKVVNTVLFDYVLSAAYLIIVFLSPILSSIADYKGNKKKFMQFFCYVGSISCCGLFIFGPQQDAGGHAAGFAPYVLEGSMLFFMLAAVGYCGSLVFYNSYLPEIAGEKDQDRVSAKGFALGYIGSIILQVICFIVVLKPDLFGIKDNFLPSRISFFLVGLWWVGFAQVTFARLPASRINPVEKSGSVVAHGFNELKKVYRQVVKMPVLKRFLRSFFFYSMGVQTVMLVATIFGGKELELPSQTLIVTIMIIQFVAIAGAYMMSKLSEKFGNLPVLAFVIIIWIGICIGGYFIEKGSANQFYILGGVVGLVMGGIQSLSRSTYSKLMPETKDTASFFSFYDVTEKLAIVIGTFSFGLVEAVAGNMRNSVLALMVYFVIAFVLMLFAIKRFNQEKRAAVQEAVL
ncbi:MFS transporter [Danxiaibacter flavus]|uniref:MFS transporter n=1 Tax=Danxiaibacter flavus TaxID=3049108 RepID=A0ABV3ZK70_9BACT|nr:MFS transporter [Chitinophagaceae bacterium DXS]